MIMMVVFIMLLNSAADVVADRDVVKSTFFILIEE